MESAGELDRLARVLSFQSIVDATISAPALISNLYDRIPPGDNELVVFDINRFVELGPVLTADPGSQMESVLRSARGTFALTVVTNESVEGESVVARTWNPGSTAPTETSLSVSWPQDVYSLSHVALPFPPDDRLYGADPSVTDLVHLGRLALYGERGLLVVPDSELLRQRWNPFHDYMIERALQFMSLGHIDPSEDSE
jgi:hypothetical protein